jgi:hypothetical protein
MLCLLVSPQLKAQIEIDTSNSEPLEKSKSTIIEDSRPKKATLMSAVLPGLGQVYNKRYWKVPIIYLFIGATAVFAYDNYQLRNAFSNQYKDMIKSGKSVSDPFIVQDIYGKEYDLTGATQDNVKFYRDQAQRQRDFNIILMLAVYAMNIIDANVDAHLREFEINDNLTLKIKPDLRMTPDLYNQQIGLALQLNFREGLRK